MVYFVLKYVYIYVCIKYSKNSLEKWNWNSLQEKNNANYMTVKEDLYSSKGDCRLEIY